MAKHNSPPIVNALAQGLPNEITVPEDGDLASMRAILKHGQRLTLSPIKELAEIKPNDIVFVRWHGSFILHLVQEVQGEQFLIANSLGKVNGWVHGSAILGRVTRVVDPPPRPPVPVLLDRLEGACQNLIQRAQPDEETASRLISSCEDFRWYASRLGPERWGVFPRQNKMSFHWHLWHTTGAISQAAESHSQGPVEPVVDHAKEHVGYVAVILQLFNP